MEPGEAGLASVEGQRVVFADGSEAEVDEIILATGFTTKLPPIHVPFFPYFSGCRPFLIELVYREWRVAWKACTSTFSRPLHPRPRLLLWAS